MHTWHSVDVDWGGVGPKAKVSSPGTENYIFFKKQFLVNYLKEHFIIGPETILKHDQDLVEPATESSVDSKQSVLYFI